MKDKMKKFLPQKDQNNANKTVQDNLFNPDYIDFDDFGHVEIRCMRCGTPIMSRAELPSRDEGVKVIGMKKLANYRQIDRKGKATVLCCVQCEPAVSTLSPEDESRVDTVQLMGWIGGMVFAGKSDEHITRFVNDQEGK